ncbi:hypothetical protein RUND412_000652 [Rhizina undulata]
MTSRNSATTSFNVVPSEEFIAHMSSTIPRPAPTGPATSTEGAGGGGVGGGRVGAGSELPRPKRIACVVCRKRKLRCDGNKPSCGTCSRLGHDCAYNEVRRKSGPKRGYVKALEARLAQVETLLKDQNATPEVPHIQNKSHHRPSYGESRLVDPPIFTENDQMFLPNNDDGIPGTSRSAENYGMPCGGSPQQQTLCPFTSNSSIHDIPLPAPSDPMETSPLWDMMSMGVEEALPEPEVIDALHKTYFEKVHPCVPMIHRSRYLAKLNLAPSMRPPIFLRYAMWTMAASVSEQHSNLQTHFYRRARKYIEDAELRGHGEDIISVAASQAWSLIACYEFKLMYFPRAWLSTGRAVRLAQMMGMHRLDGVSLDVKQCLPAPRDWTEREERRRTFWFSFCIDRYASIGTGWPMAVEEKDILSNLPVSEEAFDKGKPAAALSLKEAMSTEGASDLSPYGGVCLMACLFGRNLIHLHRPDSEEEDNDLNGEFWRRHRHMDNILLNIALSLPSHFRLPGGINDQNVVFTNMNIHTSTICLHQAAIFKAEKNRMASTVSAESKIRCITAAAEIASIMRMVSHLDLSGMNPFISFCLYVAARVFVQYLKSRPTDEQVRASLQFLLTAMGHLKKKNPLTESFLVQLDVDLTGCLDTPVNNSKFPYGLKKGQAEIYSGQVHNTNNTRTPSTAPELRPDGNIARVPCFQPLAHNPEVAAAIQRRAQNQSAIPEIGAVSPHSQHSHSGQSPASMDMSDNSQNMTPSSYATPPNNPSSASSYSPMRLNDLPGAQGMGVYQVMPKEMNWGLFGLESGGFDSTMVGMGGMNPENFNEYFAESTA